jgi:hypothetical protein
MIRTEFSPVPHTPEPLNNELEILLLEALHPQLLAAQLAFMGSVLVIKTLEDRTEI